MDCIVSVYIELDFSSVSVSLGTLLKVCVCRDSHEAHTMLWFRRLVSPAHWSIARGASPVDLVMFFCYHIISYLYWNLGINCSLVCLLCERAGGHIEHGDGDNDGDGDGDRQTELCRGERAVARERGSSWLSRLQESG